MTKPNPIIRLLSSYGLSCVTLLLLFVLTWLGTLAQVDDGLHAAQKKYFDSFFVLADTTFDAFDRNVLLPLPGGQLLMWILCANLLVGGMLRMRRNKRTMGVFITHIGIAMMLIAGFVKYYHADDGHLTLYEGERADEFQDYYKWEIAITRELGNGQVREFLIPGDEFTDLERGESRKFVREELPFDLVLDHYMPNSGVRPKGPRVATSMPVIDGFYLLDKPLNPKAEGNVAGAYASIVSKAGGASQQGILYGMALPPYPSQRRYFAASTTATNPWVFETGGETWGVELRHVRYPLPFTLHLDDFTHEKHPRTGVASNYQSDVTMIEGDVVRPLVIRMNEPLREAGFIVFQTGYGPQPDKPTDHMWSKFTVVRNPSDQWPLYSCIVIAIGLLIHFVGKLLAYSRSEARRAS